MNEWAQQSMRPDFCSKQQCMPRQTCLPALRVPTHACPQQTCLDIKNKEKTALSSDVWLTKAPSFTCLTCLQIMNSHGFDRRVSGVLAEHPEMPTPLAPLLS